MAKTKRRPKRSSTRHEPEQVDNHQDEPQPDVVVDAVVNDGNDEVPEPGPESANVEEERKEEEGGEEAKVKVTMEERKAKMEELRRKMVN
jgi:hypothetical protein